MSVSDPLIRDIKGCALKLFNENLTNQKILDSSTNLEQFSQTLEKIFYKGLIQTRQNGFYSYKKIGVLTWMNAVIPKHGDHASFFSFINTLEQVQACKSIRTPLGKFKLLVRTCLVKKCLHIPLELLMKSGKAHAFYMKNSVLGDEILAEILLSVILQCNKINFQLDLSNLRFLDTTWQMPEMVKLQVVPCNSLGLSVSFSDSKAIIVDISPSSVASEFSEICVGDMLANLNGVEIDSSSKGNLEAILHMKKHNPVDLVVVKATTSSGEIFGPIRKLLVNLKFDISRIKARESDSEPKTQQARTKAGFTATYLGSVDVGSTGNVKQIQEAVRSRLWSRSGVEKAVIFEIGEMCVKIFDPETNELIMKHPYMQISSCGSAHDRPNHVAYIAGDENCDTASNFTCYIFYVSDVEDAATILQSIGQGFYRTHFAV